MRGVTPLACAAAALAACAAAFGAAPPPNAIVFSADRAPLRSNEIYRLTVTGRRTDLSRSAWADTNPVVSPNGKLVAFVSARGEPSGRARVWMVGIDGHALQAVSKPFPSALQVLQPAWSPDSTRLAVADSVRGEVWVLQPRRAQRLVARAPNAGQARWSPDGRLITFTDGDLADLTAVTPAGGRAWRVGGEGAYAWSRLGRVAVSFGTRGEVYDERGKLLAHFKTNGFAWSPDGRLLAVDAGTFVQLRDENGRLLRGLPVFGQSPAWWGNGRIVVTGRFARYAVTLATGKRVPVGWNDVFSPSGAHRYSTSKRTGGGFGLEVDGREIGTAEGCTDDGSLEAAVTDVQFTPDERSLVYQSWCPEATADLWTIAPDGSGLVDETRSTEHEFAPQWSPDGTRIVYVRQDAVGLSCKGCPSSLWTINADGSGATRLTNPADPSGAPGGWDDRPSWSPDGSTILFTHSTIDTPPALYTVPAASGAQHALQIVGGSPAWGPARIAWTTTSGIWTAKPDGSDRRETSTRGASYVAWSRDGQLAWVSGRTLVVAGRRVALPFVQVSGLAWSPDGSSFALTARAPGAASSDVWTIRADGTHPTRLTTNMDAAGVSWR